MQKEIEIIRIMAKPSFEEVERRKPLVADGIQPRKFERDETFNLLKQYRRCLARTSVPGVKQVSQIFSKLYFSYVYFKIKGHCLGFLF